MSGTTNPTSPTHEYVLADYTVTAVGKKGIFQFCTSGGPGTIEDFNYDGKPESKTVQGSGSNPRAHTRTLNKPTCELSVPVDVARSFKKFVGPEGIVDVNFTRQAPGGQPVTDVVRKWKPLVGGNQGKSGDAQFVKVTGNAIAIDDDIKKKIA